MTLSIPRVLTPLLVAGALLSATPAWAVHPALAEAKDAFGRGDFLGAMQKLDAAERAPELTEDELADVHWYRAMSQVAMGKDADADKSFERVLQVRPLYEPNKLETSPPVRAAFEKRAEAWRKLNGVTVRVLGSKGAALEVAMTGKVDDVGQVQVFARPAGEISYRRFQGVASGPRVNVKLDDVRLWENAGRAGKFEIVVEARRSSGGLLARLGDAVAPHALPLPADAAALAVKELAPTPEPAPAPPPAPAVATRPTPEKPVEKPAEKPAPTTIVVPAPQPVPLQPAPPPPQQPAVSSPMYTEPLLQQAPPMVVPLQRPDAAPMPMASSTEGAPSETPRTIMQVTGGLALAGAAGITVLALGAFAAAVAAWATFGYTHQQLGAVGSDFMPDRSTWETVWYASSVAGGGLLVVSAGTLALAVAAAGLGAAALVRSFLM